MTLLGGTRLGPYEILAPLGAGGMGEVYRARDTRLGREVAVKVLSSAIALDADHLRRFEQEARSASALSDPHIVTVFDVGEQGGIHYFASELVDGGDLRTRLGAEGLPVKKAIDIAEQIASGLASAHEKGITHRDLKPENILLTKSGEAKIADFGLAKLAETPGAELSQMPTADRVETTEGVVMGTVSYMSPEQATGRKIDYRSDQFSFGLILYEMLTGKLAFHRETKAETLAAILRDEPAPVSESNPRVPAPLCWVVERCLAKDPVERYASTRDLAREISTARRHFSDVPSSNRIQAVPPAPRSRERTAWMASLLATFLLALFFAAGYFRRAPRAHAAVRASVACPEGDSVGEVALSPDGEKLAFTTAKTGSQPALWVRVLAAASSQRVAGAEDAHFPFWSPDSGNIGFFSGGKMKKADLAGGTVLTICDAERGVGGTWSREGTIVFAPTPASGLSRVSASGGQPSPVTKLNASRRESSHRYPSFLPDGRHFLYTALDLAGSSDQPANAVRVASLDGKSDQELVRTPSNALYSAGSLIYVRGTLLLLQRFDPDRLRSEGVPVSVAERPANRQWLGYFAMCASDRLLIYQPLLRSPSQLTWFNRDGKAVGLLGEKGLFHAPRISPDGHQVAIDLFNPDGGTDLWTYDISTGAGKKFAFGNGPSGSGVWSPDGSQIAFFSNRESKGSRSNVWIKSLDGTKEQRFPPSNNDSVPEDWSRDGRHISFGTASSQGNRNGQVWVASLPDGRDAAPFAAEGNNSDSRFSPDGRWIAYSSDESGRSEVWVRPFPGPGGKWQVSASGGAMPCWKGDGKELYYLSLDNQIMAVPVSLAPTFHAGSPAPLFRVHPNRIVSVYGGVYDVTADGQRFLVNSFSAEEQTSPPLNLIVDWKDLPEKK